MLSSMCPLKQHAEGCRVISLPIIIYSDDTSGNHSKKWNKFDLWAMMFAGLPRKDNAHFENIHFLCASNKVSELDFSPCMQINTLYLKASAIEMVEPLAKDLLKLEENGIVTYDAYLKEEVLVVTPIICMICDNPRASELVNHLGTSATCYCRLCLVSCQHYRIGRPHVSRITRNCLLSQ